MPFLSGYGKRKEIRYGTVFPDANLSDYPKLLTITADSDIAAELAGGGGIAITTDDETTLVPFGLYPTSAPASGTFIIRAKFPTLLTAASTGDVLGYIYYDSGQSTTEDRAGVVDNDYALFAVCEEDPSGSAPQIRDWVTDTLLGTSAGSMTSGDLVAGKVGNALDFDATDDGINFGSAAGLDNLGPLTCEAWIYARSAVGGTFSIFEKGSGTTQFGYNRSSGVFKLTFFRDATSNPNVSCMSSSFTSSAWHFAAVRWDGGQNGPNGSGTGVNFRIDGANSALTSNQGGGTGFNSDAANSLIIGQSADMLIDELRISTVQRADAWIDYGYDDENTNSSTFSLGSEEVDGGAGTTVTPSTASLSLTTFAPTVSTPVVCTPATASLSLTPFAPTVSTPVVCTPDTAALSLTPFAPTVSTPVTATPSTAALSITPFAPTILTPVVCTPSTAALTLTPFAPSVLAPRVVIPGVATLTLTRFAPTVTIDDGEEDELTPIVGFTRHGGKIAGFTTHGAKITGTTRHGPKITGYTNHN